MSKIIQLTFVLTDDLGIKSIAYDVNDTELPSNGQTLGMIAMAMIKALHLNKDSVLVQDLLNELDIKVERQ